MSRALILILTSCATLAEPAGGNQNLPTSGVGPFRKLAAGEVMGIAPYVLDTSSGFRSPSALALGGTGDEVALYAVARGSGHDVIVRTRADDGRDFYGATLDVGHTPRVVLSADEPWETADLGGPSAVAVAGAVWLYYTSGGAVGLAKSVDGLTFEKTGAPLALPVVGAVDALGVALLPDATFTMILAQGGELFDAASVDGVTWTQATPGPVLVPQASEVALGTPCVVPRVTPADRLQLRVLFTSTQADGSSSIAFAARYATTGRLSRATTSVYSVSKHEAAPTLFEAADHELLYVEQDSSDGSHRAIAAGIAPVGFVPAPPTPFPHSP